MPFAILFIGIVLVVVAIRGSYQDLFTALGQDIPGFVKWGAAIAAICGVGYVPGFQKPSRYLLALVLVVIIFKNYQAILAGFTNLAGTGGSATSAGAVSQGPTATYSETTAPVAAVAAGETPPATAQVAATAASATGTASPIVTNMAASAIPPTDPAYYLNQFYSPSAGFGGTVV